MIASPNQSLILAAGVMLGTMSTMSPTENIALAGTDTSSTIDNHAFFVPAKPKRKGSKRHKAKTKTVEELYDELIKAGLVRIIRRKGKPPLIQWL